MMDEFTLKIDSYGSEGQGIGRLDGMAVFVPGALAGEVVSARAVKTQKNYIEAKLVNVISPSPGRAAPACPYYGECGGCGLMHMDYSEQLALKTSRVRDAMRRIGGFADIDVRPCIGMDKPLRSRNKAVFSFDNRAGRVVSGCLEEKSHRVVETEDCLIQCEASTACLRAVTDWANRFGVPSFSEKTGKGVIRHLLVRTTTLSETMAVIVSACPLPHEKELADALIKAVPGIKSIVNNINPLKKSPILGKKNRIVWGAGTIREIILGLRFNVGPESFLQVNPVQTRALYTQAVDALGLTGEDDVFDLYCGVGTLSLLAARKARSVMGIEYVERAVQDAKLNALINGFSNAEFLAGGVEELLPKLLGSGRKASKILLDPPRKGAAPEAVRAIASIGAERIVYVSCDPATLARDCKMLAAAGYTPSFAQPVDMFPETAHVESVVLMTKE